MVENKPDIVKLDEGKISKLQELQMKKLQALSQIQIQDLVDESKYVWTPQAIEAKQPFFQVGETINLLIPKGDYICNVSKSKFLERTIIKQDGTNVGFLNRMLCINSPKSKFQVTQILFDSEPVISQQGERSRAIFNAVLSRFKDSASAGDSASQDKFDQLRYKHPYMKSKFTGGGNTAINQAIIRPLEETDALNQPQLFVLDQNSSDTQIVGAKSQKAYLQQKYADSEHRLRYYKVSTAFGDGIAQQTITPTVESLQNTLNSTQAINARENEFYTYTEHELGDLCIELASLQNVPMNLFQYGIVIQLRLLEPQYSMSCMPHYLCNQNFIQQRLYATDSYLVTDCAVKVRRHDIMFDKLPLVKEIAYQTVYPFLTYSYKRWSINNSSDCQFDMSLNTDNLIGMFCCMTSRNGVSLSASSVPDAGGINYLTNAGFLGKSYTQYDQDHVYFQTKRVYLQIDGTDYTASQLLIKDREKASYIEALSEASVMFPNREYCVSPVEFLTNRYVYFCTINNHGVRGMSVKGKKLGFYLEFGSDVADTRDFTQYDLHVFFLHTKSMAFDPTKGMIVE